jgi:hypothetical protein
MVAGDQRSGVRAAELWEGLGNVDPGASAGLLDGLRRGVAWGVPPGGSP